MSAENFERSLAAILSAEEKKYQEEKSFGLSSTNGFYFGIFDRPTKRRKKIIVAGKENEFADLDLENSDTINNLIKEFNQISMEIGYTEPVLHKVFLLLVQHPNSWPRIIFIFSILKRLILQNPMPATLIIETDVQDLSQATVQQRPQVTISQILRFFPNLFIIDCPPLWMGTINFLFILMREHESDFVQVNPDLIINLVKQILRMANSLPKQLSTIEFDCIEKSLDLIDAFLIGRCCSGVSIISHYQIIEQLPAIYDNQKLVNGRYQNVHWTMEQLIDGLCRRRQNLAYLMMPPGNHPHEYIHLASLPKNRPFECEYEQLVRQGQATNLTSNFRDMFFQHAPVEEVKQMIENLKSINDRLPLAEAKSITDLLKPLHKAIVSRVKDVVLFTQQHSNFEPRKDYQMLSHEDMVIPENLDFWELVIEMADQLYSLVASDFIKYEDLLIDFVRLLQPGDDEDDDNDDSHPILQKDNTLIWLLLQLWHIDAIGAKVIVPDLQNDERLFTMFVGLYNENQIKSKDAFYLRDLSLPCALSLQQPALQDRGNLKYRHPQLASALHYTPVCHQLLINYPKTYKDKVTNHDLFRNLPLEEIIKLSVLSQAQKVTVADTLYVYLISDKLIEIGKLAFPDAKFLKGGNVGYKLLDFLNIFGKNRFGQLIHKMVHDGDSWSKSHSDTGKNLNCVSPYIIDVVYKIIYGAPWSLQLMISEIFDKLRKVDNSLKQRAENGSALQEHTTRWHHTILELLNYRLLRFLKFSPRASNMLNFVKNSLSYVRHRQIYRGVEMFAIHSMTLQIDVKFIKTLADPNRDKSFWFGESEMLSRIMILTISRLIKFRGFSDISLDLIQGVLESLYPKPLQWSRDTLEYFPEPMQVYLASQQVETGPEFDVPKVFELIKQGSLSGILEKLLKGQAFEKSEEDLLIEHYSQLENQPIFLCIIWTFCILNKKVNSSLMNPLRKVLLQFSPSRMSTYTIVMVDFVIDQDYGSTDIDILYKMLEDLIWKYQILAFEHVIFALMRGNRDCDHGKHKSTLGFLDYLLFQSEGFSSRVKHLMSLNFNHRYWAEDDYHEKLMKYLEQYPEFFEFEAFAMKGYETVKEILEPPSAIHMPIYYSNVITRTLPILDLLISRLIELEEKEILAKLLDNYGCLYPYHQTLLSYVRDLFHYYYQSETIRDPVISKKLVHLLDLNEYDIAPELLQYAKDENFPENLFDENYFHRVFHKLADYMSPKKCAPKSDPKQPERHYCEIANPVVQALYIACIEILASPIEPQHIVTAALNTVLGRDLKNVAVQPIVIHAIALLFSFLPIDIFLLGAFNELITVIKTDPNLLQNSSSCTLERQSFKDPRIPPTQSTFNSTPQPLPFQPLFASLSLEDMLRPVGLNSDPFSSESEPNKTMMFPYIFNDYLFNLYNYGTNVPNSFLTFIHSLLHYSNTDMLEVLFTNLMARGDGGITTDIQVLYMCALVGPVLHRLDKSPLVLKQFLLHILELLHEVTSHMRTEEITVGKSTEALEQIYDFLNHVKPLLDSDPDFMHQIQNIVRLMKPPVQNRLCGFIWSRS